jgi:hypothetical protein
VGGVNLTKNVTVSGGLSAISIVWRYPGASRENVAEEKVF